MIKKILAQFLSLSEKNVGNFVKKSLELLFGNGPIQWRGSASMGFSKSRVEDEWLGETHHRGQNSKQIDIAKFVSKFLIYGAKMLDKCVKDILFLV